MVKTSTLTLRRQWTDKLQHQQIIDAVAAIGVRIRLITTGEEEVVLESSELSRLCEAERIIKEMVIDQLGGADSSVGVASSGLENTAHDGVEMDQELEKQQQQKLDASVEGEETYSDDDDEDDGCTRPGALKEDRKTRANDRKEARRIEKKHEKRAGSPPEQRRGQPGHGWRTSSDGFKPGSDTASVKSECATAVQESDCVAPGMQSRTGEEESREGHYTGAVKETSVSSSDDASSASSERWETYRIDEPLWEYIQFIDPQSRWDKKFVEWTDKLQHQKPKHGDEMVELSGSSADIDSLKKFCDGRRLKRAVKREMQRVPERRNVSAFLTEVRELSGSRVLVRQADDCQHKYCELVGKKTDVDELLKIVDKEYPGLSDAKNSAKDEQPKLRTEFYSTAHQTRTDMSAAYHCNPHATRTKPNSEDGFQFCTPVSKLKVTILTGDLLKQRCEILVNPSNPYLGHQVGLSKLLAAAAGYEMERECHEYLYKYRTLQTSTVMDTTAGKMWPPVRRIIHACGPTSDLQRCGELLQWTFFYCFTLANDKQHARSIAVPAISSGSSVCLYG